MKRLLYLFIISSVFLISSCGNTKRLTYFNDAGDSTYAVSQLQKRPEPTVQPGDILTITVNSLNSESNQLFNKGVLNGSQPSAGGGAGGDGYLVNSDGSITFPVIGQIKLLGMTREEVRQKMVAEIGTFVKDPIVSVRFSNFKITVIGEVNKPSSFTVPSEKINIIEALGLAGDMTPYGKRNNVLLIREENGQRMLVRLDLNKKELLSSQYFYLKQNDVLYVEPVKYKDPSNGRALKYVTTGLSIVSVVLIILIRLKLT
jgi:polysaccharide export outer membrane protein